MSVARWFLLRVLTFECPAANLVGESDPSADWRVVLAFQQSVARTRRGQHEESGMDKDRIAGKTKEVTGGVKEKVGRATGDKRTEAEGAGEKTEGKVQGTVGKVKDAVR